MVGIAGAALMRGAAAARAFAQLARFCASTFRPGAGAAAVAPAGVLFPEEAAAFTTGGLAAAGRVAGTAALGAVGSAGAVVRFRAELAAAILLAAAASEAVRAIGTRAAALALARAEPASTVAGLAGGAAGEAVGGAEAGVRAALGAASAAGFGGAVRRSSTTGSSSTSSRDGGASLAALGAASSTGTAVALCPSPRNISGSTKLRPVCSGSRPAAGESDAGEAPEPAGGRAGAMAESSGSSTGRSGSSSSGGRDAASIRNISKQRGHPAASRWLTDRGRGREPCDAAHSLGEHCGTRYWITAFSPGSALIHCAVPRRKNSTLSR
jgi:hypothetical protein